MSYRDAIAIAARSVTRRLGRAVLTVLAVALAAALLSSLLIAGTAARSRVLDEVSRGGPLTGIRVDPAAPDPAALDSDNPAPGAPKRLDEATRRKIAALPGVRDVVPVVVNPVFVVPPANMPRPTQRATTPTTAAPGAIGPGGPAAPFRDQMVGVDLSRIGDVPVSTEAGRLPDARSTTEVAVTEGFLRRFGLKKSDAHRVLGLELEIGAPRLFAPVGELVVNRNRWTRMSIVGVVAQEVGDGQVLAPISAATDARAWAALGVNADIFGINASPYSALFVVARSLALVAPVRAEITKVGFSTSAPETLIDSVQRYVHVVEIVLGGIGLIGFVIAALGITNAMLAAVRERRREIGVLKAIGARDRDVRRIFLLEAATLGCVGGAIGTTAGWLTARALAGVVNGYLEKQGLAGVTFGVPTTVLLGGVVGATLLALVAGTVPAQRAARLPARRSHGGPVTPSGVARRGAALGVLLIGSLGLTGCSHSGSRAAPPAANSPATARREVLVTIGSAATFGIGLDSPLRDAWPQRLYRADFPRSTVFVNTSFPDVTVDEARAMQLPVALQLHATVVTVWLGDGDLSAHHSAGAFEADLDALVARLRHAGARVLIGNLSRARAGAAGYDDAIARVAGARGATVVDVASAFPDAPGFGPGSGVNPTTSAKIAQAFASALARS